MYRVVLIVSKFQSEFEQTSFGLIGFESVVVNGRKESEKKHTSNIEFITANLCVATLFKSVVVYRSMQEDNARISIFQRGKAFIILDGMLTSQFD